MSNRGDRQMDRLLDDSCNQLHSIIISLWCTLENIFVFFFNVARNGNAVFYELEWFLVIFYPNFFNFHVIIHHCIEYIEKNMIKKLIIKDRVQKN